MTSRFPDAPADAGAVEQADLTVADAIAPVAESWPVKALGFASEISDQPPMRALCAAVIAAGLWRRDRRLAEAGLRMLAAHSLATGAKTFIKNRIDRTRPDAAIEQGRYHMEPGGSHEHEESSFPSGHTAGAVAAAVAFAHSYPEHRAAAYVAAGAVSLMQIPRCKHYPSDVGAGAAIGAAAAGAVSATADAVLGRRTRSK